MTFEEYCVLRKRLKKGKKYLELKWSSDDSETKRIIDIWFKMSDMVYQYDRDNEMFPDGKNWKGLEEYLKLEND